ncbi:hypothetical protein WJX74_005923 [Apatococcus lobatus]|uniref:Small ribosomal subunit protein uS17c n=1 Tax=Apatococcus lobatus TaxID=904363 RepID=A0AAW1QWU0_9CHLO
MKTVVGKVVSNKMQKSILVGVTRYFMHKKYPKRVNKQRKFMAHDEEDACNIGDVVRIDSSRPISKMKAWRLTEILRREPQYDAAAAAEAACRQTEQRRLQQPAMGLAANVNQAGLLCHRSQSSNAQTFSCSTIKCFW